MYFAFKNKGTEKIKLSFETLVRGMPVALKVIIPIISIMFPALLILIFCVSFLNSKVLLDGLYDPDCSLNKLKRDKARGLLSNGGNDGTADNFELFIGSTDINWCYYKDSHRVLGSTVGMLVLQDFLYNRPMLDYSLDNRIEENSKKN